MTQQNASYPIKGQLFFDEDGKVVIKDGSWEYRPFPLPNGSINMAITCTITGDELEKKQDSELQAKQPMPVPYIEHGVLKTKSGFPIDTQTNLDSFEVRARHYVHCAGEDNSYGEWSEWAPIKGNEHLAGIPGAEDFEEVAHRQADGTTIVTRGGVLVPPEAELESFEWVIPFIPRRKMDAEEQARFHEQIVADRSAADKATIEECFAKLKELRRTPLTSEEQALVEAYRELYARKTIEKEARKSYFHRFRTLLS